MEVLAERLILQGHQLIMLVEVVVELLQVIQQEQEHQLQEEEGQVVLMMSERMELQIQEAEVEEAGFRERDQVETKQGVQAVLASSS
jgi:hypothetical protein